MSFVKKTEVCRGGGGAAPAHSPVIHTREKFPCPPQRGLRGGMPGEEAARTGAALPVAHGSDSASTASPKKLESPASERRRKSARSEPAGSVMQRLASQLVEGKARVVFVTGAGISVASGIPPFRGASDAVWETSLLEWGTKRKFLADPRAWYDSFWLPTFKNVHSARPNAGHDALSEICRKFPGQVRVITQNIDRLHSGVPEDSLIEIHGKMGEAKCFTEDCPFSQHSIQPVPLVMVSSAEAPICKVCHAVMAPNSLLFDEEYDSHDTYQFDKAKEWLEQADTVVFCGTSFSVRITDICFQLLSKRANACAYNFNVDKTLPRGSKTRSVPIHVVEGKLEETLPALKQMLDDILPLVQ